MTERRLLEGDATDFESSLLRAASNEMPSEAVQNQMLAPLAAAGAGTTAAASAGGVWVKWGAGAVLLALGAGALTFSPGIEQTPAPASQTAPIEEATKGESVEPQEPVEVAPEAPAEPVQEPRRSPSATTKKASRIEATRPAEASGSTLRAEMQLLDQARASLKSGDPERALTLLGRYDQMFPHGSLGQEATVLRVSALEQAGQQSSAAQAREQFLQTNPQSAHRKRLEEQSSSESDQ